MCDDQKRNVPPTPGRGSYEVAYGQGSANGYGNAAQTAGGAGGGPAVSDRLSPSERLDRAIERARASAQGHAQQWQDLERLQALVSKHPDFAEFVALAARYQHILM